MLRELRAKKQIRRTDQHRLSQAVPSIMTQSSRWGSQIADPKKWCYLRWLTFVQEKWLKGHTSYLRAE